MSLTLKMVTEELSRVCKELDIPNEHIRICAGGAAMIHGLRESTMDIDVDVLDASTWNKLLLSQNPISRYEPLNQMSGAIVVSIGNIDFHYWDGAAQYNVNICGSGFVVQTKPELLEMRIRLGRYKDLAEIVNLLPICGDTLTVEVVSIIPILLSRITGSIRNDIPDIKPRKKVLEQLDFILQWYKNFI